MHDLEPPARELATLVKGVSDEQLDAPTPCATYTVGDLLDHLMALAVAFRHTADKTPMPPGESAPGEGSVAHLDPAWREELPRRLDALVAAWRDPDAWTGESVAGGVTAPAHVLGTVTVAELVLHGWDLARGTDQPFRADPAAVEAAGMFTAMIAAPGMEEARGSAFGPPVAVADAYGLERVLAQSGRDPLWPAAKSG
ncbi:MAG TPA: TIGR03086 family metal-binding protein [Pseudonocardia sp.]|nr:TIGR03086 family metal-binding protein [Pseudonocardia sp.]